MHDGLQDEAARTIAILAQDENSAAVLGRDCLGFLLSLLRASSDRPNCQEATVQVSPGTLQPLTVQLKDMIQYQLNDTHHAVRPWQGLAIAVPMKQMIQKVLASGMWLQNSPAALAALTIITRRLNEVASGHIPGLHMTICAQSKCMRLAIFSRRS